MKERKFSIAMVLAVLIGMFSSIVCFAESPVSSNVYQKSCSMENVLSDFQYFIQGDLNVGGHTVGAVACGGTANISNFGDGATAASYFNNIASVGNYAGGNYFMGNAQYSGYVGLPAYYKTAAEGTSLSSLTQYTGSGDYIDFNSAFTDISKESADFTAAADAYTVTNKDITGDQWNGYTLNLTFATSKNVVIPKDIYDQINYIKLSGIADMNDLIANRYIISVTGVDNVSFTFSYISYSDSQSNGTKGILCKDGQSFNNSNSLKNMAGVIQGGQMNMDGMKLIWNIPAAKTVTSDYTDGHIVAPKAAVTIKNATGNFEGGVIAASVNNQSAEGHFYPYSAVAATNTLGTTTSGTAPSSVTTSGTTASNATISGTTTSNATISGTTTSNATTSGTTPSSVTTSGTTPSSVTTSGTAASNATTSGTTPSSVTTSGATASNATTSGTTTSSATTSNATTSGTTTSSATTSGTTPSSVTTSGTTALNATTSGTAPSSATTSGTISLSTTSTGSTTSGSASSSTASSGTAIPSSTSLDADSSGRTNPVESINANQQNMTGNTSGNEKVNDTSYNENPNTGDNTTAYLLYVSIAAVFVFVFITTLIYKRRREI